jgi:predicted O-linked N-acetylglucosamine transferase (SPINDLY family)
LGEGLSTPENWPTQPQDRRVELPLWDTVSAAKQVLDCQLDILVYCDIGMEPSSYFLALSKLAPIQCVTWGHPITTGLNTMDAMISSRHFESPLPTAQAFYTEPLYLLETLPTWYRAPEKNQPLPTLNKNDFGVSDSQTLYSCPQSLYKIHPAFDELLEGILQEDETGQIVFFEGFHPRIHQSLLKRWHHTLPAPLLNRIHFLPRTDAATFYSFLRCSDVMLDPVHFGGGNTSLEALSFGTPIVTLPSPLMRGRFTQGFYQHMGATDWIASDPNDYIQKACLLGKDSALRHDLRQTILATNHVLYENPDVIEAWETCLLSLVEKSRHAPPNM